MGYFEQNVRSRFPCARVGGDVIEAAEELEGWVSLNTVFLAQIGFDSAINLCECNVLLFEGGCSLLVLGRESFAVAAPWCEDWVKLVSGEQAGAAAARQAELGGTYILREQGRSPL